MENRSTNHLCPAKPAITNLSIKMTGRGEEVSLRLRIHDAVGNGRTYVCFLFFFAYQKDLDDLQMLLKHYSTSTRRLHSRAVQNVTREYFLPLGESSPKPLHRGDKNSCVQGSCIYIYVCINRKRLGHVSYDECTNSRALEAKSGVQKTLSTSNLLGRLDQASNTVFTCRTQQSREKI